MADNSAFVGRLGQARIQCQIPPREFRCRPFPVGQSLLDFRIGYIEVQPAVGNVNGDFIAISYDSQRATLGCFGGDVTDEAAIVRSGKSPVGNNGCFQSQSAAIQQLHGFVHLPHSGDWI